MFRTQTDQMILTAAVLEQIKYKHDIQSLIDFDVFVVILSVSFHIASISKTFTYITHDYH